MRLMKSLNWPRVLEGRYILVCKMGGVVEKPPTMSIDEADEVLIQPRVLEGRYILVCRMGGVVEKSPTMFIDEAYEVLNLAKGVGG